MKWLQQIKALADNGEAFAMVTVIETTGSAPREVGARIVVTETDSFDSIGGGNLEYEAIAHARRMLSETPPPTRQTKYFGLGVTMNQCCGGAVRLLFERCSKDDAKRLGKTLSSVESGQIAMLASRLTDDSPISVLRVKRDPTARLPKTVATAAIELVTKSEPRCALIGGDEQCFIARVDERPTRLVLFGAGHVGKALVKALEDLPFDVQWIDSREDAFPDRTPPNTKIRRLDDPVSGLENQPPDAFYAVMTHSHGLDYEICLKILRKRDFAWLGLIGSEIKRQRFIKRFADDGLDAYILQYLHCPIGRPEIKGKMPAVIAMSTVAQLLEERNRCAQLVSPDSSLYQSSMRNASAM